MNHYWQALAKFRARLVLDKWLRLGIASIDYNVHVRLNLQDFIPNQDLEYIVDGQALKIQ